MADALRKWLVHTFRLARHRRMTLCFVSIHWTSGCPAWKLLCSILDLFISFLHLFKHFCSCYLLEITCSPRDCENYHFPFSSSLVPDFGSQTPSIRLYSRQQLTPPSSVPQRTTIFSTMLLRLRGPDGMARITVEPTATFGDLGKKGILVHALLLHSSCMETQRC